jgi:hypothetical protein
MKSIKLFLFILALTFTLNAAAQTETAIVGEAKQIQFNIANVVNSDKCNIEVTLPNKQKIGVEVEGPQFMATVQFTPQQAGSAAIQWEGKTKFRGLKTVGSCPGSGVIQVQVNGNTEQIAQKWDQYFSRVPEDIKECVKVGMDIAQLKYQLLADLSATLTSPDDQKLKPIYEKCEGFAKQNKPRKSYACNLLNENNIKTTCDGVYAEKQQDGRLRSITRAAAMQLYFEGKPWSIGEIENLEVRISRIKQENDNKAKQAENIAAQKDIEEREKKLKESPEYKKQQAELELKKRLADEKEAVAHAQRDKAAAAAQAKKAQADQELASKQQAELERKRLADEKEAAAQAQRDKAAAAAQAKKAQADQELAAKQQAELERKRLADEREASASRNFLIGSCTWEISDLKITSCDPKDVALISKQVRGPTVYQMWEKENITIKIFGKNIEMLEYIFPVKYKILKNESIEVIVNGKNNCIVVELYSLKFGNLYRRATSQSGGCNQAQVRAFEMDRQVHEHAVYIMQVTR